MTLRRAFAQSINTISVQLAQAVGLQGVIDIAKSLGIHTELPPVSSLALGSAKVTLLDMTGAMDAIAVNAKSIEPYTIRRIRGGARAPLYTRPETVIERPDWNRAALVPLLESVVNGGTGRPARLDRSAAGKTGTTQDYRDAWFIGFTTDITVGVWVGNDDNSPMDWVVGGDLPAKIWHDFVEASRLWQGPGSPLHRRQGAQRSRRDPATAGRLGGGERARSGEWLVTACVARSPCHSARRADSRRPATLIFHAGVAHLQGVEGETGEFARQLMRYIGGREVMCEPSELGVAQYRCTMGKIDLRRRRSSTAQAVPPKTRPSAPCDRAP